MAKYKLTELKKARGSIPDLTQQTDLHRVSLRKLACKAVCDVKSAIYIVPFELGFEYILHKRSTFGKTENEKKKIEMNTV